MVTKKRISKIMDEHVVMKPKIVKEGTYGNRRYYVVLIDFEPLRCIVRRVHGMITASLSKDYHNGYIELRDDEYVEMEDDDLPVEITYGGDLSNINRKDGKRYIVFDSAHFDNWENPETMSLEFVEKQCKKIIDNLNARGKHGNTKRKRKAD